MPIQEWYGEPSVVMAPVVETDDTSERFLTKDPIQGLIDGESANVPLLIGTTKDEMAVKALRKFFHILILLWAA